MLQHISRFSVLLAFMLSSHTAMNAQGLNGDMNGDGRLTIEDIALLTDAVLGFQDSDNHAFVDLGLSSGTLWATCNVGADAHDQPGRYFAWGETSPKANYSWATYVHSNGDRTSLTKYCTRSSCGTQDGKTTLDLADDAAYVVVGKAWCMPTKAQMEELMKECTWTWTYPATKRGYEVKGPNGRTIFLPSAGYMWNTSNEEPKTGAYLTRNLDSNPQHAVALNFNAYEIEIMGLDRSYGYSIRPVRN